MTRKCACHRKHDGVEELLRPAVTECRGSFTGPRSQRAVSVTADRSALSPDDPRTVARCLPEAPGASEDRWRLAG